MAMPSSLHLPSRALGPQPTVPARNLASPATDEHCPSPKITDAAWGHIAAHPGMPGSIAQREPSTQKLDQCRRARTAGSGCAQPAGQSSSAAYRTAGTRAGCPATRPRTVIDIRLMADAASVHDALSRGSDVPAPIAGPPVRHTVIRACLVAAEECLDFITVTSVRPSTCSASVQLYAPVRHAPGPCAAVGMLTP